MSMDNITHAYILRRFSYDPVTGVMTHRETTTNRVKVGDPVGHLHHTSGYLQTRLGGKTVKVHRVIWFYQTGAWPSEDVDHIDGNRSNNAWSNLRQCSREDNLHNMRAKNPRSGFKGVVQRGGSFMVRIRTKDKIHHIGSYSSAEVAASAHDEAALRLHGPFAKTNKALGLL